MAETKALVCTRGEEGRSLDDARKPVSVAEIIRHGERLTLPKDMKIEAAIDLLERSHETRYG